MKRIKYKGYFILLTSSSTKGRKNIYNIENPEGIYIEWCQSIKRAKEIINAEIERRNK